MWIGELIEQQEQRQAAAPVQRAHLQMIVGGKVAEGVFVRPKGILARLRVFFARTPKSGSLSLVARK